MLYHHDNEISIRCRPRTFLSETIPLVFSSIKKQRAGVITLLPIIDIFTNKDKKKERQPPPELSDRWRYKKYKVLNLNIIIPARAASSGHDGAVTAGERGAGEEDDDQVRGRVQRVAAAEVRLRVG